MASVDGSGNVSLTTSIANGALSIAQTNGLQAALSAETSRAESVEATAVKYADATFNNSASGYYIYPPDANGRRRIEQWGTVSVGGSGAAVTFPTAFPNACLGVSANDNGRIGWAISASSATTTGFTAITPNSGSFGLFFRAVGW